MAKLNQIIAVANGKKSRAQSAITEVHHRLAKNTLLEGISRKYRSKDEEGDQLPPESKRLQMRVDEAIKEVSDVLTDLFDVVATQDFANCAAKADVVVNGETVLLAVPVTHLLFLEKQLIDIGTFVGKLPTLDPSEEWVYSNEAACYATKPQETVRTKKVPKNHVRAEATKEHPAQVDVFTEDVVAGYWETIKFSGAITETRKQELVNRVRLLQDAVKAAREEANTFEITQQHVGKLVFSYLFGSNGKQSQAQA